MIISNSTPLIAFARIGRLTLLKEIVGNLVIPTADNAAKLILKKMKLN